MNFLEGMLVGKIEDEVILQAGETDQFVARLVVGMTGLDDFSKAEGAHHFTESDGRHVLRNVGHPDAHGGIDGEIFDAGEGLAVLERGERRFRELEIGGRDEVFGAGDEFPLTNGGGHEGTS